MPMDPHAFRSIAHNVPSISESLSEIFEPYRRERLKKDARKAGYDDVDKYLLDLESKNPIYPALYYLECVNEHGDKSASCKRYKERWLDCKALQNGNKVTLNGEEVDKMLKKDAIKAGYKEGYFPNKDPKRLAVITRLYEECVAKHGGDNLLCKFEEKSWLECKAAQDEPFREKLKKDARRAGYDDLKGYLYDRFKKNPIYPARRYLECVDERVNECGYKYGDASKFCIFYKKCWLDYKAMQNGNKVTWNEGENDKMLKEDAIKGGYKEG